MKTIKKTIKNKYFLIGFITPLLLVGLAVYLTWYSLNYIQKRDNQIFQDAWENGYFVAQQEYGDTTKTDQDKLLNCLAMLESSGGKKRKILDTNNKYSLGLYHFQADTVKDMYWRYYHQRISTEKAVEIAQDDELATELARTAIFVKGEKYHWYNSMVKLANTGLIK